MKKHLYLMAGLVASLAVLLAATLTPTAPRETKKTISEGIPHASKEPISK